MFLIVGSVDQMDSITQMVNIRDQILECRSARFRGNKDVPLLFAVNKIDLPECKWEIRLDEVNISSCKYFTKI